MSSAEDLVQIRNDIHTRIRKTRHSKPGPTVTTAATGYVAVTEANPRHHFPHREHQQHQHKHSRSSTPDQEVFDSTSFTMDKPPTTKQGHHAKQHDHGEEKQMCTMTTDPTDASTTEFMDNGWHEATDQNTGNSYYSNKEFVTLESQQNTNAVIPEAEIFDEWSIWYKRPLESKKGQMCFVLTLLVLAGIATTGIVCGSGACTASSLRSEEGGVVVDENAIFYNPRFVTLPNYTIRPLKKISSRQAKAYRSLQENNRYSNYSFNQTPEPTLVLTTDTTPEPTPEFTPEPPFLDAAFLFLGQSNMAGRGEMNQTLGDLESIDSTWLFRNDTGYWEPARNPLNFYSTYRKGDSVQKISPAYGFALKIQEAYPRKRVGLLVQAVGETKISYWLKGVDGGWGLYENANNLAQRAMKSGPLKAILWHQGESDRNSVGSYMGKLKTLIQDLRTDLGDPNLPFVAGELMTWNSDKNDKFNTMIDDLPDEVPNTAVVVVDDGMESDYDTTHFDRKAVLELGKRSNC